MLEKQHLFSEVDLKNDEKLNEYLVSLNQKIEISILRLTNQSELALLF